MRSLTSVLADAIRRPAGFLAGDGGNIRRLAEHLGCSMDDATAVYHLARREGYPTAYQHVFGVPRQAERRVRVRGGRGPAHRSVSGAPTRRQPGHAGSPLG